MYLSYFQEAYIYLHQVVCDWLKPEQEEGGEQLYANVQSNEPLYGNS